MCYVTGGGPEAKCMRRPPLSRFVPRQKRGADTDGSFGNKFRDWCNQGELYHCSAHGLRKAGATIAANNGASAHQLMAIFGWDTIKEAEKYTAKVGQRRLAESAMHPLDVR